MPNDLNVNNQLLSKANAFFREGNYKDAINLYKKIETPLLKKNGVIAFNLTLSEIKWAQRKSKNSKKAISTNSYNENINTNPDAFQFAHNSFLEWSNKNDLCFRNEMPKVSIIVTCFNAEDTIQESIESLLNQNYPDLEIIVCDDFSIDNSWRIISNIKKRCSGLKILRNNSNYGTYLSKNRAIEKATGEILLFQDSDDVSHPMRVRVQVTPLIRDPNLLATRTKYLRYNEDTGRVIPVDGLFSKLGLITLAVRKNVFRKIGYFDSVRRAGDDEFFQRIIHIYGKSAIEDIDTTLYLARLRDTSLIADIIKFSSDRSQIEQTSSFSRKQYVEMFKTRFFGNNKASYYRSNFPPFPLRSNMKYPETIKALDENDEMVFVSLCSIPERFETLIKTVRSLENQVDKVFIYFDKYDSIPQEILNKNKITILRSQDYQIDYRDNAKFLAFNELKNRYKNFYYFTVDDDIEYPQDYIHTMIKAIKIYDKSSVVGVHGVIVEENPIEYFKRRFIYHFSSSSNDKDAIVNNLGTGTIGFYSEIFDSICPEKWKRGGMADIFFSIEAKKHQIPMICIGRHNGWLNEFKQAKSTPNLYAEFNEKEKYIVQELRQNGPWGYKSIDEVLQSLPSGLRRKINSLLPKFYNDINIESCFHRLR